MKKKILIIIPVVMLLLLSGCSNPNDYLTDKLKEKIQEDSGISEDSDYQNYQNWQQNGELDDEGKYLDKDLDGPAGLDQQEGQIHVTFAENSHINVTYYRDAELTEQIDTSGCHLNPGDSIYASEPKIVGAYSDKYVFSGFRILQFDSDGQKSWEDDDLVIEIPVDYESSEISVLPLGKYGQRVLTLDDRYVGIDGNEAEFYGVWQIMYTERSSEVTNSVRTSDTLKTISATEDYTVSYDYSAYAEDYYFVRSDPVPFKTDTSGIITFSNSTAQNGCEYYYVLLHRFINVKVDNEDYSIFNQNIIKSLSVDGEEQNNFKKKEFMIEGLKCGDVLILRIDSNYKVTANGLYITAPVDVDNGNMQEYTITVPETYALELGITISKKTATLGGFAARTINNATISVKNQNGDFLMNGDEVNDNEELTVTITPENGYYVTGKKVNSDIYQDTMKYKEYVSTIDKIIEEHPIKKFIRVTLDDSDDYGICVYTVDSEMVNGTVALREGQRVKLEYTLTDSGRYQIDTNWLGSKTKGTGTLDITEDFDGKTLSREDFGIQVKDK